MLKITFLFCLFVLGAFIIHGQPNYVAITGKNVFKQTNVSSFKRASSIVAATTQQTNIISQSMLVSPQFYSNNLAFFCRQEIKLEKLTKIPFKFRLGSIQYVDYLEGKPNSNNYK